MEKTCIFSVTYDIGDGFLVDVVVNNNEGVYEAWLYHKDKDIKALMFSCLRKQDVMTSDIFSELVRDNFETQDFITNYKVRYMGVEIAPF